MKWRREKKSLSRVWLCVTPWTVAHQAPWSMGFSRHEYWSGLPFPSPGDLPNPGMKPRYPALEADALPSKLPGKPFCIGSVILWTSLVSSVADRHHLVRSGPPTLKGRGLCSVCTPEGAYLEDYILNKFWIYKVMPLHLCNKFQNCENEYIKEVFT